MASPRRYRYYICDVFTDQRFGGNPLGVVPEAEGLSDREMQQIAREFNFSESTFVLPSEEHSRRVRIFTPTAEIPFAGHPNVGTAFALATAGAFGEVKDPVTVTFDEKAGIVPVTVRRDESGSLCCELEAPQRLSLGKTSSTQAVAAAVSLSPDDVVTTTHPPREASVGLPFLVAELRDRDALQQARWDPAGIDALAGAGLSPDVHLYVQSRDEFDIRARMFAPLDGVPEDPATGERQLRPGGLPDPMPHRSERAISLAYRPGRGDGASEPPGGENREEGRRGGPQLDRGTKRARL